MEKVILLTQIILSLFRYTLKSHQTKDFKSEKNGNISPKLSVILWKDYDEILILL